MKYIASCSGGKDSVATLLLARERNEPLDEVVYAEVMFDKNISGEMPEHRDFVYNRLKPFVENELGVPFTVVRSEKTYMDVFMHTMVRGKCKGKTRGFAIPGMCAVNRDCKLPGIRKFWSELGDDVTQYVGIAADEETRLKRLEGTNRVSLLAKYGVTEEEAKEMCRKRDLLSPSYNFTNRNGCWFCPNIKDGEWRHLIETRPDLFQLLIDLERNTENIYRECLTRKETPSQLYDRLFG